MSIISPDEYSELKYVILTKFIYHRFIQKILNINNHYNITIIATKIRKHLLYIVKKYFIINVYKNSYSEYPLNW